METAKRYSGYRRGHKAAFCDILILKNVNVAFIVLTA